MNFHVHLALYDLGQTSEIDQITYSCPHFSAVMTSILSRSLGTTYSNRFLLWHIRRKCQKNAISGRLSKSVMSNFEKFRPFIITRFLLFQKGRTLFWWFTSKLQNEIKSPWFSGINLSIDVLLINFHPLRFSIFAFLFIHVIYPHKNICHLRITIIMGKNRKGNKMSIWLQLIRCESHSAVCTRGSLSLHRHKRCI